MNQAQALASQNNPAANDVAVLPAEKTQAVQHLIKLTQSLIDISEREAQGLAQNDMISFAILQDEKAMLTEHYAGASDEFRARLPEFRGMNPALIDRLQTLQNRLGQISRENNTIVTRLYERAEKNAKAGLKETKVNQDTTKVNFVNHAEETGEESDA